jgi:hypothetical protein
MPEPDWSESEEAARDLISEGIRPNDAGQLGDEIAVYGEVVARVRDATEEEVQSQVARALTYIGMTSATSLLPPRQGAAPEMRAHRGCR